MRHALTLALQEYDGGVVLVSHDRALLRTTCDRFLLVADGAAVPFDGDLEDYKQWLAGQRNAAKSAPSPDKAALKAERAQAQADRQALLAQRRKLTKEVEQLDKKLAGWHGEKTLLDERLADPALYENKNAAELQILLKRQAELSSWIEVAEERWLEIHEVLEALPAP